MKMKSKDDVGIKWIDNQQNLYFVDKYIENDFYAAFRKSKGDRARKIINAEIGLSSSFSKMQKELNEYCSKRRMKRI